MGKWVLGGGMRGLEKTYNRLKLNSLPTCFSYSDYIFFF